MKKTIRSIPYVFLSGAFNIKMLVAVFLIGTIIYINLSPIIDVSDTLKLNINYGIISLILSDSFSRTVIFIAVLFAFSNLPIRYPVQYYSMVRAGKRGWLFAQILYVLSVSLLLLIFIIAIILILCGGRLYYSEQWGKIINGIANNQVGVLSPVSLYIDPNVLAEFTPSQAVLWTVAGTGVMFMIFGFVSLVLNLVVNEFCGTIINGLMVFMNMLCELFSSFFKYYISPLSWCSISVIDTTGRGATPDYVFVLTVWGVSLVALITIAVFASGKNKNMMFRMEGY